MEGFLNALHSFGLAVLFFFAAIFPYILAVIQVPLAIKHTISRIRKKKGMKGWVVYWVIAIGYLFYLYYGKPNQFTGVPQYFWLCYVPGIWFFFAGKVSDRLHLRTTI